MKKIFLSSIFSLSSLFAGLYEDAETEYKKASPDQKKPMLEYVIELSSKIKSAKDAEKQYLIDIYGVTVATGLMHGLNEKADPKDIAALKETVQSVYSFVEKRSELKNHLIAVGISTAFCAATKLVQTQFTELSMIASSKVKEQKFITASDKEWVVNHVLSTFLPINTLRTRSLSKGINFEPESLSLDDMKNTVNRAFTEWDAKYKERKSSALNLMGGKESTSLEEIIYSVSLKVPQEHWFTFIDMATQLTGGMKPSDIQLAISDMSNISYEHWVQFKTRVKELTNGMDPSDRRLAIYLLSNISEKKWNEFKKLMDGIATPARLLVINTLFSNLLPKDKLIPEHLDEFIDIAMQLTDGMDPSDIGNAISKMLGIDCKHWSELEAIVAKLTDGMDPLNRRRAIFSILRVSPRKWNEFKKAMDQQLKKEEENPPSIHHKRGKSIFSVSQQNWYEFVVEVQKLQEKGGKKPSHHVRDISSISYDFVLEEEDVKTDEIQTLEKRLQELEKIALDLADELSN